jgi:hypothetical protein
MLRHLTGVQHSVKQINSHFRTMAILAGGAMTAIGGAAAVRGIWSVVEASRKLNDELTRTKQLGGAFAQSVNDGSARSSAFSTASSVPTFAPSDLVRMQRELGTQMQNPQAASQILPMAARIAASVSNYTGEDQETIVKNLIKVADIRGQIFSKGPDGKEHVDAAKLESELNAAGRGLILGGNYLKSNDLLQMARQSGVPAKTMTQEGFYAALMEMAVSQGASRTGTATTSLFSQLVGSTMPLHTAVEMQRMGMMTASEWHKERGGKVVIGTAATERFEKALKDPIGYITGPLNDLLTSKGMNSDQKLMEVFRLFGRQTTQRLVAEALSNAPQFARARSMFGDIPDPSKQFGMLMNENLSVNIKALHEAWQGFMESLGSAGTPAAISILHGLTAALHELTAFSEQHPGTAAAILEIAAGLGALAAIGGSLQVAAIGLRAFAPALRIVGIALAMPGYAALGTIAGGLVRLAGALSSVAGPLAFLYGVLHPSSTQSPEADRAPYGGKSLHERFPNLVVPDNVPLGPLLHKESFVPSGGGGSMVRVTSYTILDGRKIAETVSDHQARALSLPSPSASRFDSRMTPSFPSDTLRV